MRETIALNRKPVAFEDFFVPYCRTLSLNWPLPPDCILITTAEASLAMNPAFEYHLRELQNWSLGAEFRNTFPQLVDGSVRIRD